MKTNKHQNTKHFKNRKNLLLLILSVFAIQNSHAQTWDEIVKLNASDIGVEHGFGFDVAISEDYAVVGASHFSFDHEELGAAYIFERTVDDTWVEVDKIIGFDTEEGDAYGFSVDIHGDQIIVGAYADDDDGSKSGSAYVIKRGDDGIWAETQKLTASDAAGVDLFGYDVSINGDYAVVGALGEDEAASEAGAAYIFKKDVDGLWNEQQKIFASDGATFDEFGRAVSISGSYVLIGAQKNNASGVQSGAAYIFEREDVTWTQVEKLSASDGATYDFFGSSVSIDQNWAVVGAEHDDDDFSNSGSAYIFERDEAGDWSETQKIKASDPGPATSDNFGKSVAIDGNFIIVGSFSDDVIGVNTGSAYIFEKGIDDTWSEIQKVLASDADHHKNFGMAVSISDNHVIIGSYINDDDAGSAYIFQGCIDMEIEEYATDLCEGEEVILDATSGSGDPIIWTDGIANGEAFLPPVGTNTYIATAGEEDCTIQVEVIVHEAPTVEILVADSIVCDGDEITLSGDGAVSYVWEEDITDGEAFIPELGETTYTVTGTDDNDCENSASINILVNALPTVMATADDSTVCDGDEITLSGDGATTYVWDEGATDGIAFTPPLGETTYTVIGTDDNACENTASLTILVNELPTVTASVDETLVCEGDEITLTGSGATTYLWDEGAVDGIAFEPPVGETTYTVTGTDDNGCSAMDATTVTVLAAPDVAIATLADDILCLGIDGVTLSGTPTDGTFSGTGMTGFQFDPNVAGIGSHTVYYTYENDEGCSATDSVVIQVVDCLGINDLNNLSFNIYPNPFTDFATIAFNQELTEAHQIIVYDLIGQEVYRLENITGSQIILTKEELGTGVYFLSLSDNKNQIFTAKLIIQ